MIVDLTGEVVPCCFWSGYGNVGKPLGNTNLNSIDEIWNGTEYQALRRANASGKLDGHPCNQCMAYSWSNGNYPPFTSPIPWRHESGHCYLVEIPESFIKLAGESLNEAELLENGTPLPFPNGMHDDIRKLGEGRYSVWGRSLYFSTSDNSDPSDNGRSYELNLPHGRIKLQGLVIDSVSGQNILKAREEYREGVEVMSAKPTMISLISTADCNIDCPGCSQNMVRLVRVQHRAETVPDVLAHVRYLYQFIWHGGEPYLIKRFRQFVDDFRTEDNPNLAFGFTSNGTMLTAKEFGKLQKFPRINASISMDSFNKETFEKIRKGADYDKVLGNVLRAIATYDAPDRVFSVGMIVCKSNFLELPENLKFAIEHDIGLNLSPVVIYPVTEQLDVFENFQLQTRGWQEALDQSRSIMQQAKLNERISMQRVDPSGMLASIEEILKKASADSANAQTITFQFEIKDPFGALGQMRRPGVVLLDECGTKVYSYFELSDLPLRTLIEMTIAVSAEAKQFALLHDLNEPMGVVLQKNLSFESDTRGVKIVVPQFIAVDRKTNIHFANYGETTPQGLHVTNLQQITEDYAQLVTEELLGSGRGNLDKKFEIEVRLEIDSLRSQIDQLRSNLQQSEHIRSDLHLQLDKTQVELQKSEQSCNGLFLQLEKTHADLQRSLKTSNSLRLACIERRMESSSEIFNRLLKNIFNIQIRLSGPYRHIDSNCWLAPLGELAELADDVDWQESPIILYENCVKMDWPHAQHEEIKSIGGGRYSCWGNAVFFSTTDNTDPNTNGRHYTLKVEIVGSGREK